MGSDQRELVLVLIAGGFDLSVGSNLALTSICSSMAMVAVLDSFPDLPWLAVAAGFVATLGVGVFAGACNAFGVGILRVNPFIVTLATTSIFRRGSRPLGRSGDLMHAS
jgi:ribose transport system permease protein